MKKLNAMIFLLALSAGMFAQFTPIGWVNFSNHPADFDAEPYAKKTVEAMKAGFTVSVDELDEIGIPELWDHMEAWGVAAQDIPGLAVDDGELGSLFDLGGDDTYGSQFKVLWDDDYLYVLLKFVDAAQQNYAPSTKWEICYQTAEADRYEAGWQAATDVATKNQQYGAFIELGAGKAEFVAGEGSGNVSGNSRSKGADGSWTSALGAASTVATKVVSNWGTDGDNTIWAVLGMSFADYLVYLTDPTNPDGGLTSLDPTVKTRIAWDVQANGFVGNADANTRQAYFWNSDENDGYALVYYNGYLDFVDAVLPGVSTNDLKVSDKGAFIYDNVLRMKGFESNVNLEIYSIVGQKVMSAQNVSTLNVSELNRGIYIVKVAGEKQAFKVVKQ